MNADFRRRSVRGLIPFVGRRDQVAVAIARGDIGKHGRGQRARVMELLALLLDRAFVAEFAQQALEFDAHGVLEAKGAGDFAGADIAALGGDEGENVGLGGRGGCSFRWLVQNRFSSAKTARPSENVIIEIGVRYLLGSGRLWRTRLGLGRLFRL